MSDGRTVGGTARQVPDAQPEAAPPEPRADKTRPRSAKAAAAETPVVDPMQWWGALTQQFQGIAAAALKDVAGEAMKAGMSAKNATTKSAAKAKAPRKKAPAKEAKAEPAAESAAESDAPPRTGWWQRRSFF